MPLDPITTSVATKQPNRLDQFLRNPGFVARFVEGIQRDQEQPERSRTFFPAPIDGFDQETSEFEALRAGADFRLASQIEVEQLDSRARYLAAQNRREQLVVFGSLTIDVIV